MILTKSHLAIRHAAAREHLGNATDAVFFDRENDRLRIVATDGNLLAMLDTDAPAPASPFILSIEEADTLATSLDVNGSLRVDESNQAVALGGFTYLGNAVAFPNYRKVVREPAGTLSKSIGFDYKLVQRAMGIIEESHPMSSKGCVEWVFDGAQGGVHLTIECVTGKLTVLIMPMIL